jgi:hypothetical protein
VQKEQALQGRFLKDRVKWRKVGELNGTDIGRAQRGGKNGEAEGGKAE